MEPLKEQYKLYMVEQLKQLMAIDSIAGFTHEIEAYLDQEIRNLGFEPKHTIKGGVLADLGGEGNGVCVMAHADTIGLMVKYIRPNGNLVVANVGGLRAYSGLTENVRIRTRCGKIYTGVIQKDSPSQHTTAVDVHTALADYDKNVVVFLDEDVHTAAEVFALGIACGDSVSLEPRLTFTESGYIKSRFLDDKTLVAILLTYMKYVKEEKVALSRKVWANFTMFEEINHGGAHAIPADVTEAMALDIGPVGPTQYSSEKKVSIAVKDARFPYNYETVTALKNAAEQNGIGYALDMYLPGYGSDSDITITAGYDVKHSCIGPGVLATHGYERTHIDALVNTWLLLKAYLG